MGAALSSPIQQLSVLVSLVLALIFLGESLTPLRAAGIILVLFGPLIILRGRSGRRETHSKPRFVVNYVEGFAWGLVGAVAYGVSPLFIRFGLAGAVYGGGIRDSIAGASPLSAPKAPKTRHPSANKGTPSLVIGLILAVPGNIAQNQRAALESLLES